MSAQRLGAKGIRRTARWLGEPVKMAWTAGNHHTHFVTPDHRHGLIDKDEPHEVRWAREDEDFHFTTCYDGTLFSLERSTT